MKNVLCILVGALIALSFGPASADHYGATIMIQVPANEPQPTVVIQQPTPAPVPSPVVLQPATPQAPAGIEGKKEAGVEPSPAVTAAADAKVSCSNCNVSVQQEIRVSSSAPGSGRKPSSVGVSKSGNGASAKVSAGEPKEVIKPSDAGNKAAIWQAEWFWAVAVVAGLVALLFFGGWAVVRAGNRGTPTASSPEASAAVTQAAAPPVAAVGQASNARPAGGGSASGPARPLF